MVDEQLGDHPPPPEDLGQRDLPLLKYSDRLWRIYLGKYDNPLFFGKNTRHRFDAPDRSYGVCYCGCDIHVTFVETLGHSPGINFVTRTALKARSLVAIRPNRDLEFVDLTAGGLRRLGAEGRLTSGSNYESSRKWSQAIFEHPERVDGIIYRSRNDQSRYSVAIFERAADVLEVVDEWRLDSQPGMQKILPVIEHYGFGIG